jgi:hypothetical protein
MIIDPVTVTISRHQLQAMFAAAAVEADRVTKRLALKSLHRHERADLVVLLESLESAIDRVAYALHRPRPAPVDKTDETV